LIFDGEKVREGGDVDVLGFENGPTISERESLIVYFKYEHNDKRQRKVYMCTQSSNYSPSSIPSLLDGKSIASFILYPSRFSTLESLVTGSSTPQVLWL
jgi:hypothetical protein